MSVLQKGVDFTTGQQVSANDLDNLVDAATFATGAVDNATTQLSGGAIIVKDGGITAAKLASASVTTPKLGSNLTLSGTTGVGTSPNLVRSLNVRPASDQEQIVLQQSNDAQSGWGQHADTSGNLLFNRYAANAFDTKASMDASGNLTLDGTIKTAAGVAWDVGAASVVSPTSPNRTIAVVIAGTTYYLHAKTTND